MIRRVLGGALAALALSTPAQAEDAPICTDRPGKATGVRTVPASRLQLETSLEDWMRTDAGGIRTDVWQLGSSQLKLGLTDHSDIELGFTPYIHVRTKVGGIKSSMSGVGDVTIRYKHRFTNHSAPVQVAIDPFIKLPTAKSDIGNGKVEGGLTVPISFSIGGPVSVSLAPEVDLLADADRGGHHAQLVNVVDVGVGATSRLSLSGEIWTATNFDPDDTVTQFSADASAVYLLNNKVQLDAGANFGLNRNTPDIELYAGVSLRF